MVVGHRGAPVRRPENTLESFEEALRAGSGGVEMDVRLTRDGVPVIVHDPDLRRSGGPPVRVADLKASEVRRLAPPVPTLREALMRLSGRGLVLVEIKGLPGEPGYDPEDVVPAVLRALDEEFRGPAAIVSFDWRAVELVRHLTTEWGTGLLCPAAGSSGDELLDAAVGGGHRMVLPAARALERWGAGWIERCRARGILVATWVVNDPNEARRWFDSGVDVVASDDPAAILPALREHR